MLERTEGQAARGIYMPKPQLEQAVLLIEGFRAGAEGLLTPDAARLADLDADGVLAQVRSEEHTSELQSLMRISYAVFCLKKNTKTNIIDIQDTRHKSQKHLNIYNT